MNGLLEAEGRIRHGELQPVVDKIGSAIDEITFWPFWLGEHTIPVDISTQSMFDLCMSAPGEGERKHIYSLPLPQNCVGVYRLK